MKTDTDTPTTPADDPTVANELRELNALTNENPAPGESEARAEAMALNEHRAQRVAAYTERVRPFVAAWGGRLRRPLQPLEVDQLADALADVGAEIIPEGDTPAGPWSKLLAVTLLIAAPRVIGAVMDRARGATDDGGEASDRAPAAPAPTARGSRAPSVEPMADLARDFDGGNDKPH